MQADFSALSRRVREVTQESTVGARLRDVVLEADQYDDGSEFLRVVLYVSSLDGIKDTQLRSLIESIEQAVGDLDERFPSVRFADAA